MVRKINISLQKEMENLGESLRKVTAAAFAGAPGVAPSIKGKRKSAQITFKIRSANEKQSLATHARREILGKIFAARAPEIERVMKIALQAVIAGLVGAGNANVKVFSRSLGIAKPKRALEQEAFAKFIKSKAGAGEIGLPDPSESIRNLKAALLQSITVDVVVRKNGPQIKFVFDQRRLLKLTPHPDQFEGGVRASFFSWLSLVTGPDFLRSGIDGFSLVRASDIKASLRKSSSVRGSRRGSKTSLRRINIAENLISLSRTRGNAGKFAGIMMRNRAKGSGRSPAEAFGGQTEDYRPSSRFEGFWDIWWLRVKAELSIWGKKIVLATTKELLKG